MAAMFIGYSMSVGYEYVACSLQMNFVKTPPSKVKYIMLMVLDSYSLSQIL
jgi:hypothetical protein